MATYSKELLSGSTDGKPVKVAATATPGTTIHTAHATAKDEIWCWITNTDTSDVNLTIEYGGTTDPDHLIAKALVIPAKASMVVVIPGTILTNSMVLKMFASSANKLLVTGYVNRITP